MTVSVFELVVYAGGIFLLFMTPGPVWIAIVARTLYGGVGSAFPLAIGVLVGDIIWPLLAIIGMNWFFTGSDGIIIAMRWIASSILLFMGFRIIILANKPISNGKTTLNRPGALAGFIAGLAVILGNPKAILFYIGVLPGFFDLKLVNTVDIIAVVAVSCCIPFIGNLTVSLLINRVRVFLQSKEALRKTNIVTGILLILVGIAIPFIY